MSTKIDVRIDDKTKKDLQDSADEAGMRLSTYIRLILKKYKKSEVLLK